MGESFVSREGEPGAEREPQVGDVVAAFKHVLSEMAPVVVGEELDELVSQIENSVDAEDALGAAVGAFVQAGVDDEIALARIGEILQVEAIVPNGDQSQNS